MHHFWWNSSFNLEPRLVFPSVSHNQSLYKLSPWSLIWQSSLSDICLVSSSTGSTASSWVLSSSKHTKIPPGNRFIYRICHFHANRRRKYPKQQPQKSLQSQKGWEWMLLSAFDFETKHIRNVVIIKLSLVKKELLTT